MGSWWNAIVGVGRRLMGLPEHTYDVGTAKPIVELLAELNGGGGVAKVDRDSALSVAAVLRGRNDLCSLATLPLRVFRGLDVVPSPLLRQIDPNCANVITLANTVEDLLFERTAWWRVLAQDFDGYPVAAQWIPVGKVSLEPPNQREVPPPGKWIWVDGDRVAMDQMIRFDSPNPGLLTASARSIRRALLIDKLAATYADNPRPLDYFTDTDDPNVEPFNEQDWMGFLARWRSDRKRSGTGRIPGQVKRVDVSAPSPAELQLAELQKQVTLEIANGLGVDPEDLGVSTTSRTYQNAVDRKQDKINRVYAPYMTAITDRLSMGDVTRRGYAVRFDLTDYLKSDPQSQAAYWKALQDMGVTDEQEIRGWAGLPGRAPGRTESAPIGGATAHHLPAGAYRWGRPLELEQPRFAGEAAFTFDRTEFDAAAEPPKVDQEARTITGLAVPYGAIAKKYGVGIRFLPGSLEYDGNVKHFKDHMTPVGSMRSISETSAGPEVVLTVGSGPEGSPQKLERDQLLYDAADGLYNGLSVGVDFELFDRDGNPKDATYNEADDTYDVHRATLREVSTTPMPAFNDARVTKVAASMTGGNVRCTHCGNPHAPGIACASVADRFAAQPTGQPNPPAPQPDPAPQTPDVETFRAFTAFQEAQRAAGAIPQAGQVAAARQFVDAGRTAVAQVTEPAPYRFDRRGNLRKGSHDFSSDLYTGWQHGDQAARDRAEAFVRQAFSDGSALENLTKLEAGEFAVTSGNVAALNPNRNRPDMYVDQMEYTYPIWEAINKGTLEDITPFVVPKYSSSSGLVANHVEGTEPTPGAFTATAQTITPSAVSGKVEYTREAWDQGGNPQASGLIWRQMVRGYYEALEAYAVSSLAAVAASLPDITITTAAADSTLDQALADAIVPLHFIRGGMRFRRAYTQIDLYKAMAKAKDSAGRRLYPAVGPQNAAGTTENDYSAIDAHGILWLPAWALAATGTVAASSYMFDPEKVCGWATAPQRIDIQWRVAWVDIGVWGYKAFAVTDYAGTREVIYDPV